MKNILKNELSIENIKKQIMQKKSEIKTESSIKPYDEQTPLHKTDYITKRTERKNENEEINSFFPDDDEQQTSSVAKLIEYHESKIRRLRQSLAATKKEPVSVKSDNNLQQVLSKWINGPAKRWIELLIENEQMLHVISLFASIILVTVLAVLSSIIKSIFS